MYKHVVWLCVCVLCLRRDWRDREPIGQWPTLNREQVGQLLINTTLASCYTCGEPGERQGTAFVAQLADHHLVRFRVSDCGINWVESRNGHELVSLEGAEAIQEMQRVANVLRQEPSALSGAAQAEEAEAA